MRSPTGLCECPQLERLLNIVRDYFGTFCADLGTSMPICSVLLLARTCTTMRKCPIFRNCFGRSAEI